MTFDARDLRRGMDTFSADGTYLGTVLWVVSEPVHNALVPADPGAGLVSAPASRSAFSGESLGPMPTARIGNSGPIRQSDAASYASRPRQSTAATTSRPAALIVVRLLTALNWSTLRPSVRRIPVSQVQSVSLERIVLIAGA